MECGQVVGLVTKVKISLIDMIDYYALLFDHVLLSFFLPRLLVEVIVVVGGGG